MAGSAIGLINVVLGIGTAVATVPLLLRYWDQQTYAIWLAVFAVYSLLQTADTGHTGYLGNEFLRLAHSDPAEYRRTFASGLRVAVVLGAAQVLIAVALLLVGLVPRVLGIPLSGSAAVQAGLALVALALGWWASGSLGGVIAGLYLPAGSSSARRDGRSPIACSSSPVWWGRR
jgi:small-conductance mechanosensitive channel